MNSQFDSLILQGALRNRSPNIQHLTDFLALPESDIEASLLRLEKQGLLEFDGTQITCFNPAVLAAANIRKEINEHAKKLQRHLDILSDLSDQLSRDSDTSSAIHTNNTDSVTLFRGDLAGTDALEAILDSPLRTGIEDPQILGMMPNPNPPLMTAAHQKRIWDKVATSPESCRLLVPRAPDAFPEESLLKYKHLNFEVRWIDQAPSWFWINTRSGEAAIPLLWGETFPFTVIVVRQPALIKMLVSLFHEHWAIARPMQNSQDTPIWEPVLRLMRAGLSIEESAERLEISTRTARRYLERGMQHYGVHNIFGLGAAWSAANKDSKIPFSPNRPGIRG